MRKRRIPIIVLSTLALVALFSMRNVVLRLSAREGLSALTWVALLAGGDPNAADREGNTPLHWASGSHSPRTVELLLYCHANPNSTNRVGNTPLYWAAGWGDERMIPMLLSAGAEVNAHNLNGERPLHVAAARGQTEIADQLLRSGAFIDAKTLSFPDQRLTPLDEAILHSQYKALSLLLARGADANCATPYEYTPLMRAVRMGDTYSQSLLLAHGADIDARSSTYDKTPLIQAVQSGDVHSIDLLIAHKANVNAGSSWGTPLDVARQQGLTEVGRTLIANGAHLSSQ